MQAFVRKSAFFFLIGILVFTVYWSFAFIIKHYLSDSKINSISQHNTIVLGDSQLQLLDSSILGSSTYNFASSGESFFITYNKILRLTERKQAQVENILLGVSWHSFAPVYNRLTNVDFFDGNSSLQRYFYLIPFKASWEFSHHQPKRLVKCIDKSIDWGGTYQSTYKNPDTSILYEMLRSHYVVQKNETPFCESQSVYLKKIDSLCLSKNIRLILVSCPYHQDYASKVDSVYIHHFNQVLGSLQTQTRISFLDEKVSSDWMSDACHLNRDGSAYYSSLILQAIRDFDVSNSKKDAKASNVPIQPEE